MVRTVISLSFDKETLKLIDEAEAIMKKEGKKFNLSKLLREVVRDCLIKFVTDHGDGNPHSTMDQFMNGGFIVTPALARAEKPEDIEKYIRSLIGTEQFEIVGNFLDVWATKYNGIVDEQRGIQTI